MPKKSIEINPFDGGLNDYADPRDIAENELAAATNIKTDRPGRIKIGKRTHSVAVRTGPSGTLSAGTGLFNLNSDYNTSHAIGNTEYQLLYNDSTLYRRSTSDANFTSILSGNAYTPCLFTIDGNIRFSDGAFASDTKFIGVTDVDYFGQAEANEFTIKNSYIDSPTAGSITMDPATPANPVTINNALCLIVQQKTGSKEDWFNFNKNDTSDTNITNLYYYSGNYQTYLGSQSIYDSNTTYPLTSSDGISAEEGELLKVTKNNSSGDYQNVRIKFAAQKSYEEKSVFISVYFTTAVKNHLQNSAVTIRVGTSINLSGTSNDCYVYNIGSDQIDADAWTTLELTQGQHDDIEGSPNASGLDFFRIDVHYDSNSNTDTVFYLDNLQIGETSRGLWNGKYKFFQSFIYDKTQESGTFEYTGQGSAFEVENKILQFRLHGLESGKIGTNNRITGANIYYVEYDIDNNPLDTDKKLLIEVDLERGIKKVGGETWEAWGAATTGYETPYNSGHTNFLQIMDPPVLETFSTKAGYDEEEKLKKMKFGSAAVMNRRSYVGNVQITNSADRATVYSDRIYKSEPNMPDIYTEYGYVDVAINDGESITALASFGDILLQFKESTMYLINCTQEIEYLEDTSKFRGVWGQGAVCETDEGIVWVNKFGLFLFDGKEIIPLIDKKISPDNWNTVIGGKPLVGYVPLDRSVFVVGDSDSASKGYTFSMVTKGFSYLTGGSASANLHPNDITNLISSKDGVLSWYDGTGTDVTERKWDDATGDVYIDIQSRDQDFKDPARRKMVKNVYLTYKAGIAMTGTTVGGTTTVTVSDTTNIVAGRNVFGTQIPSSTTVSSITNGTQFVISQNATGGSGISQTLTLSGDLPTVKFRTNGGTTDYSFDSALLADESAGDWYTKVLKPATSSQANNVYSFQVRLYGATDKDFEINDINVVYRDKVLK